MHEEFNQKLPIEFGEEKSAENDLPKTDQGPYRHGSASVFRKIAQWTSKIGLKCLLILIFGLVYNRSTESPILNQPIWAWKTGPIEPRSKKTQG